MANEPKKPATPKQPMQPPQQQPAKKQPMPGANPGGPKRP